MKDLITNIESRMEELKKDLTFENLIKSFTREGLFQFLNFYLRKGKYEYFRIFREYMFCLRGSLIELGIPASGSSTIYGGLSLSKEDLKKWVASVNKIGLLPSFLYTTGNESVADNLIEIEQERNKDLTNRSIIKLYIEQTDNTEEFCEYFKKFQFNDNCGIFYPVDISNFSLNKMEEEVLFPPFYPFRIDHIDLIDGVHRINILLPKKICLSSLRNNLLGVTSASVDVGKEYVERACDLAVNGISTDLTFCIVFLM